MTKQYNFRIRCDKCYRPYPKGKKKCSFCDYPQERFLNEVRNCVQCGKEYRPKSQNQRYCGIECSHKAKNIRQREYRRKQKEKLCYKPTNLSLNVQGQEKQTIIENVEKIKSNCRDNLIKFFNPDYNCEMYKCEKMNIASMKKPCENCQYGDSNK